MKHEGPDLAGTAVLGDRYEIARLLREEPWGAVWLAGDGLLGTEVGLKVLPREAPEWSEAQGYYQKEAALALRLRHPEISPGCGARPGPSASPTRRAGV